MFLPPSLSFPFLLLPSYNSTSKRGSTVCMDEFMLLRLPCFTADAIAKRQFA